MQNNVVTFAMYFNFPFMGANMTYFNEIIVTLKCLIDMVGISSISDQNRHPCTEHDQY